MRREQLICGLLALMTLALFAPALTHDFISFDDQVYVTSNAHVQQGLTWESVRWTVQSTEGGNYWHPVTWMSHLLDCQLFGLKPWGHHLTSLLFHAANTVLLFLLLKSMTGAVGRSFFVAALFGWHPLHVESVAWVAERKDVLSTFFWLLLMLAYAKYVNESKVQNPKSKVYYDLALLWFALGLMSKPMLVTAPFVLLLLDYWPLDRSAECGIRNAGLSKTSLARLVWEKVPFFLLAGAISVAAYVVQRDGGAMPTDIPLDARVENALVSYCRYLSKLFCPINLSIFYPHPGYWPTESVFLAALLLIGITLFAVVKRRRHLFLPVGWLWFIGTLLPTIGLVQVGRQAMADRYTYVPAVGLFIMVVWGMAEWTGVEKWPRRNRILAAAGTTVLVACVIITSVQLRYWKNSETLFRHAAKVTTDNYIAYSILGLALETQPGKFEESIHYLDKAVRIAPFYAEAHFGLGYAMWKQDKLDEALRQYSMAVELQPNQVEAQFNLGAILAKLGKVTEAGEHFRETLKLRPGWLPALKGLGNALATKGDLDGAIAQYSEAAKIDPKDDEVQSQLAVLLSQEHKMADAIGHYHKVLRLKPNSTEALNNLAWILATDTEPQVRNGTEAVQLAERACKLDGYKTPTIIGTLAAAYAEAGHFQEAVETGEKAYHLALSSTNAALAETNHKLIELYRTRRPYHEIHAHSDRGSGTNQTGTL